MTINMGSRVLEYAMYSGLFAIVAVKLLVVWPIAMFRLF